MTQSIWMRSEFRAKGNKNVYKILRHKDKYNFPDFLYC
jgi:hypothetical protein